MILAVALAGAQPVTNMMAVERSIDPAHKIVEGVASDGNTVWVSSVIDRQILACPSSRAGRQLPCRTLTTLPAGMHPFALSWDATRKRLWVAADCPSGVPGIKACDRGALIGLNRAGRVMTRVAPPSGNFHPGDVSASDAGVFVGDGQNGAVYRLTAGSYSLATLVAPGVGKSAQGSAADQAGKQLMVADYGQGIASIDLETGTRTLLPRQDGKPLRGVDGVARCGDTYFGIYNGSEPGALLAITPTNSGITFDQPLPADLTDATQVAFDGKRLLIVTNAGWARLDKPEPRSEGAKILSVPLTTDCRPDFG